jgi:DNA gyrase subunit A
LSTPPAPPPKPARDLVTVGIEEEMQRSYLDYAMSVIVSRALPDVRDGLKPVHRRIIFSMHENGYDHTKPFRKSARIVGDVMGKYHPHGDAAIYDAMVRMAQDFSMRLPLIAGQGNFGSMDGDPAAAMRYTEARLARVADQLINDIDKDTVDFAANYDESSHEPRVLPARFPNLLVNGAGGIAVGMATNIPPHNLGEVIDACLAYIDRPDITFDELMAIVPGPDFPTGGIIMGGAGIRQAFETGRGSLVVRGRAAIEEIRKDRFAIVITEVPYQVNKARMVEIIAEHVHEKKIEGISDLRDESDRHGVRVVVELKRDAEPEVVLNQLYRYTPLQVSFGVNMLALDGGRPRQMALKDVLVAFVQFREDVIRRRTIFELGKARDRAHVLAGLAVAVANLDRVIAMIRAAKDPADARAQLMETAWPASDVEPLIQLIDEPGRKVVDGVYHLSETQARAILELRLHRLTGLEREKIAEDLRELGRQITEFLRILGSREGLLDVLRGELTEIKEQFANPRRTELLDAELYQNVEDLIQREDMVVTVTHAGYIKRVPLSTYRAQRRGGKGRAGMAMRDEDVVERVFVASTHTPVLFFSSRGIAYKLKVHELPLKSPTARGNAMVNMLPLETGETISTIMALPEDESVWGDLYVMFSTSKGNVRRNALSDFQNVRANGKIAMKLDEDERLVEVKVCDVSHDVLLATRGGKSIRFPVEAVRVFVGRTSMGVRGMRLAEGDEVVSMSIINHVDADAAVREEYLQAAQAVRRLANNEDGERGESDMARDRALAQKVHDDETFRMLAEREEFILTITANGYGKRSSAYEYRISNRGGQGVANIETSERNGDVVASFSVQPTDEIVMVSNGGQIIRCPVAGIRIAGRRTQGVTVFDVDEGERVVSVTSLGEVAEGNGNGDGEAATSGGEVPDGEMDVGETGDSETGGDSAAGEGK